MKTVVVGLDRSNNIMGTIDRPWFWRAMNDRE